MPILYIILSQSSVSNSAISHSGPGISLSIHGAEKCVPVYQRRSAASHSVSQRPPVVRHSSLPQVRRSIKMEASSYGTGISAVTNGKTKIHQPGNKFG